MKSYLLYSMKDFEWEKELTIHQKTLIQDLELESLFQNMSMGDKLIYDIIKKVIPSSLLEVNELYIVRIYSKIVRRILP